MDTVPVVLALGKHCQFGHSFGLVGETPELGAWDTSKVLHMEVRGQGTQAWASFYPAVRVDPVQEWGFMTRLALMTLAGTASAVMRLVCVCACTGG